MPKMLQIFFHLKHEKWLHKNSPILISFFLMDAKMTAVTIESNKIVLNEVKDN